MTLSARDPRDVDPIVTRRVRQAKWRKTVWTCIYRCNVNLLTWISLIVNQYYYSIKDISVGGMCICYGHAESCPLDLVTKVTTILGSPAHLHSVWNISTNVILCDFLQKLHCVCEHNTCGESCNQCCPGYHQQPWQPGTISKGNTCESKWITYADNFYLKSFKTPDGVSFVCFWLVCFTECNCHNKAINCFYNQTVSELALSLNTRGIRQGGGVCIDCQENTIGINCETCKDSYYRPAGVCTNTAKALQIILVKRLQWRTKEQMS